MGARTVVQASRRTELVAPTRARGLACVGSDLCAAWEPPGPRFLGRAVGVESVVPLPIRSAFDAAIERCSSRTCVRGFVPRVRLSFWLSPHEGVVLPARAALPEPRAVPCALAAPLRALVA